MANPWSIAWTGWIVVITGWLLSPIISLLVNKLFAYLIFDASKEIWKLKMDTVPALQATLRDVEEQRIVGAASDKGSRSDLERLDKMDMHLKSALYQAEDILDLVDYNRIEKEVTGRVGGSCWPWVQRRIHAAGASIVACCTGITVWVQQLLHAASACAVYLWGSFIQRCLNVTPPPLLHCGQSMKQQLVQLFGAISQWRSGVLLPISQATSIVGVQSFCRWISVQLQSFCDWSGQLLHNITSYCRAVLRWFTDRTADARYYRDWPYEQVGINGNPKKDCSAVEGLVPSTQRIRLRKQIKGIEDILTSSKRSDLLNQNSSFSTAKDAANESISSSNLKNNARQSSRKQTEIDDLHRSIEQKVFGRNKDRAHISRMLREEPDAYAASSITRKSYIVIGIYGITGSGKSTLAQYVCDHEKGAGHFNHIMFIHVGMTFSLPDIFRDMLEQITQSRPSNGKGLKSLKAELETDLKDKRFLLVLDDLWVNDENQKGRDVLLDTCNAALIGSRILVTAQKTDAAEALGAQKQILIPDLKEDVYLSLFMHHAQPDASDDDGEYRWIGRKIANRLRKSPIAAVTLGKQLQRNKSISFWKTTANLDVLNKTMGALWWSYQQLSVDIRRCFAYCSTFPKGYTLDRDELVRIWVAQGFVNTRNDEAEEPEDVGHRYFEELLTFSFLQVGGHYFAEAEVCTIHDLLHELAERVSGSEFFRVVLNGSPTDIPRGVKLKHLFIETNNGAEMVEKIMDLENLRTLIVKESWQREATKSRKHDIEKALEVLSMRLTKLRVLIIKLNYHREECSIPESINHMKHLRHLGVHFRNELFNLILPSTFSKLYHIQIVDVPSWDASYPKHMDNLIYLRHVPSVMRCFPNIGRLTSLQTVKRFEVMEQQGCELKQLNRLNKLRGRLSISGLGIVRSKEDAREANLAQKERLRKVKLYFDQGWSSSLTSPDVQAEVLEGLCLPKNLEELGISRYKGSRYPSWMLSPRHPDAPKQHHLQRLILSGCSQLASIPQDSELFMGLRVLIIMLCDWDRLPENMECLVSLQTLEIWYSDKVKLLPTLPRQSLKTIKIWECGVLGATCKEEGHENWQKIQHISEKDIWDG